MRWSAWGLDGSGQSSGGAAAGAYLGVCDDAPLHLPRVCGHLRPLALGFRTCRLNATVPSVGVRWLSTSGVAKAGVGGGAPRGGTDLIIHCITHMINNSLENSLCYQMPTLLPTANSQGSRTNCQLIWSSAVCCLAGHSTARRAGRSSSGSHLPKRARIFQKER